MSSPTSQAHAPLVLDIAGTRLDAADRRRLAHPLVGGVIHFARNWESRAQMTALNQEIRALRPDLLICVDHEGGRIQRFRSDGMTHLPSMRALGTAWAKDALAGMRLAHACGVVLASELRACGVDFSFAPVLDLDYGASSVIGDRSFDRDPRVVSMLARGLCHGLLEAGMANCGKHFPGHGFVTADSHLAIPVDRRSLRQVMNEDARPYEWLQGTLTAVMPAHVIYPKVDSRPAGFSRKWLQDVLRTRLGFEGAVFSDDLGMEAARQLDGRQLSFTEAAIAALEAGCDLAMLCNQSLQGGAALDEWLEGMMVARHARRWTPSVRSEQRRQVLRPRGAAPEWDELAGWPIYRAARARLAAA